MLEYFYAYINDFITNEQFEKLLEILQERNIHNCDIEVVENED